MLYLESHRDIIRSLNVVGEHLMEHSGWQQQQPSLRLHERLVRVNERWRKVEAMANAWRAMLHTSLTEVGVSYFLVYALPLRCY